jgi:hypothetical protein
MIDLSKNIFQCTTKELKLSREEWINFINYQIINFQEKINFSNFNLAVDYIAESIFEYMDENNIDFLSFVDCNNSNIRILKDKKEIMFEVEFELSYQLDIKYNLNEN